MKEVTRRHVGLRSVYCVMRSVFRDVQKSLAFPRGIVKTRVKMANGGLFFSQIGAYGPPLVKSKSS